MGWYVWPEDDPPCVDTCVTCGKPITPGDKYYLVDRKGVKAQHAVCAWEEADR